MFEKRTEVKKLLGYDFVVEFLIAAIFKNIIYQSLCICTIILHHVQGKLQ